MTIALLNTKNLNVEHIQNLLKHWISTKQMPLNIVPFSSYPQLIQFLIAHDHKALVLIVTPQYLELYDEVKHQRLYFQNDCIAFMDFYQFLEESRFSSNTIKALAIETPNEVTSYANKTSYMLKSTITPPRTIQVISTFQNVAQ